jgi:hypothetical protein
MGRWIMEAKVQGRGEIFGLIPVKQIWWELIDHPLKLYITELHVTQLISPHYIPSYKQ